MNRLICCICVFFLSQSLFADLDWGGGATEFRKMDGTPLSGEEGIGVLLSVHQGERIDFSRFIPDNSSELFTPGSRLIQENNENIVVAVAQNFISGFLLLSAIPDVSTQEQKALNLEEGKNLYLLVWDRTTFRNNQPASGSLFTILQLFVDGNSAIPAKTFGPSIPLNAATIFPDSDIKDISILTERTPEMYTFTISLFPDWNLISVPNDPINPSFESVFGDCINKRIWTWNGKQFVVANELKPKMGFWVYHLPEKENPPRSRQFELNVQSTSDRSLLLDQGWNLIGPLIQSHVSSFSDFRGNIWQWNAVSQHYQIVPHNSQLFLGAGYMIFIGEKTSIDISRAGFP